MKRAAFLKRMAFAAAACAFFDVSENTLRLEEDWVIVSEFDLTYEEMGASGRTFFVNPGRKWGGMQDGKSPDTAFTDLSDAIDLVQGDSGDVIVLS